MRTPHTRTFLSALTVSAMALSLCLSVPTIAAAGPESGGAFCSVDAQGGANPDTSKVRQIAQSAVDAAKSAGLTMGVSIGGAGNLEPVVNVGAATQPMYSASTIKVAVATTVYAQEKAGSTSDDLRAMIGRSDNDAANRLMDVVGGFDAVNTVIAKAGVSSSEYKLGNRMGGPTDEQASVLSAVGGAKFLMALCNAASSDGGFVSQRVAQQVLTLMGDTSVKNDAARAKLGQGGFTRLANKPGENGDVKNGLSVSHDIGIVGTGNHWFALAVTTQGGPNQDSEGTTQIAKLARQLAPLFGDSTTPTTAALPASTKAATPSSAPVPTAAPASATPAATCKTTIALDPGHNPTKIEPFDKATGVKMADYPNGAEDADDFTVASKVRDALIKSGYIVVMLKNSTSENIDYRGRVDRAEKANAALALSIHTSPGDNSVFPQRVGLYREGTTSDGSVRRVTFSNADVATRSQAYSAKVAAARTAAEGHQVGVRDNNFSGREGLWGGNIPMISLLSQKVPWVYNEFGPSSGGGGSNSVSADDLSRYAKGIVDGVRNSVPATC